MIAWMTCSYLLNKDGIHHYLNLIHDMTKKKETQSRECDSESSRETSRDSSNGCSDEKRTKSVHGTWNQPNSSDASNHSSKRVSLRSKPSTSDETESSNPPGQLIFEYFEHEIPYNREPLADKARSLSFGSIPP